MYFTVFVNILSSIFSFVARFSPSSSSCVQSGTHPNTNTWNKNCCEFSICEAFPANRFLFLSHQTASMDMHIRHLSRWEWGSVKSRLYKWQKRGKNGLHQIHDANLVQMSISLKCEAYDIYFIHEQVLGWMSSHFFRWKNTPFTNIFAIYIP